MRNAGSRSLSGAFFSWWPVVFTGLLSGNAGAEQFDQRGALGTTSELAGVATGRDRLLDKGDGWNNRFRPAGDRRFDIAVWAAGGASATTPADAAAAITDGNSGARTTLRPPERHPT